MFRKAVIKMTLVYLLILMSISLFFSVALYRISTAEIQGGLSRQQRVIERMGPFMHDFLDDPTIRTQRAQDLMAANQRIIWQLIYTNLGILIIGGGLSYFLALITLEPIEKSHEAQMRFSGDASHELRSPLASMRAEIEVALRDPELSREEAVEILESNLEEVQRLETLSGYLLKLANEEDGELAKEKIELGMLSAEVMGTKEAQAKSKKIKLESNVAKGVHVFGNSESIKEILSILLENAIKYSDSGKTVSIDTDTHGAQVEVQVKDEGVGISEKDLPHIFDRFYQADGSRSKNKDKGYGLGLSLAKKLAEANHTEITVESKLGSGSTFKFKLPTRK